MHDLNGRRHEWTQLAAILRTGVLVSLDRLAGRFGVLSTARSLGRDGFRLGRVLSTATSTGKECAGRKRQRHDRQANPDGGTREGSHTVFIRPQGRKVQSQLSARALARGHFWPQIPPQTVDAHDYGLPSSSAWNSSSVRTRTPSEVAFSSLLPAFSPATT